MMRARAAWRAGAVGALLLLLAGVAGSARVEASMPGRTSPVVYVPVTGAVTGVDSFIDFIPRSARVDNPSSYWLFFPLERSWVGPYTSRAWLTLNGLTERTVIQVVLPTGVTVSGAGATPEVIYYEDGYPSDPGQSSVPSTTAGAAFTSLSVASWTTNGSATFLLPVLPAGRWLVTGVQEICVSLGAIAIDYAAEYFIPNGGNVGVIRSGTLTRQPQPYQLPSPAPLVADGSTTRLSITLLPLVSNAQTITMLFIAYLSPAVN